jgi:hypothetical protein
LKSGKIASEQRPKSGKIASFNYFRIVEKLPLFNYFQNVEKLPHLTTSEMWKNCSEQLSKSGKIASEQRPKYNRKVYSISELV